MGDFLKNLLLMPYLEVGFYSELGTNWKALSFPSKWFIHLPHNCPYWSSVLEG